MFNRVLLHVTCTEGDPLALFLSAANRRSASPSQGAMADPGSSGDSDMLLYCGVTIPSQIHCYPQLSVCPRL